MTANPSLSDLDPSLTHEIDVSSEDFKRHWFEHMTAWSTRPPFYAVSKDGVMVMVGRYADAVEVFSDRELAPRSSSHGSPALSGSTSSTASAC